MTSKMMTINRALHPSVCRLYLPRREEGRGLIGVGDFVDFAILGLEEYIGQSEERLIVAGRGSDMLE